MRFITKIILFSFLAAFIGSVLVSPIYAQQPINQSQAVGVAKKRVGGRVLRVEKTAKSYRVKMLQESGRVVSVSINRATGKIEKTQTTKSKKEN